MAFQCDICFQTFRSKPNLYRHKADQHQIGGKVFNCSKCNLSTSRSDNLKVHQRSCKGKSSTSTTRLNDSSKRKIENLNCQRPGSSKEGNEEPLVKKIKTSNKVNCRKCGQELSNRRELYIHQHNVSKKSIYIICTSVIIIFSLLEQLEYIKCFLINISDAPKWRS